MKEKVIRTLNSSTNDMNYYSLSDIVMDFARVAHWFSNSQVQIWIRGYARNRYSTVEITLKRLSRRNKLRVVQYGKMKVYSLPRKTKNFDFEDGSKIYHGLACTNKLVRFFRSDMNCEIIAERFFRRCGSVPEWGIRYP